MICPQCKDAGDSQADLRKIYGAHIPESVLEGVISWKHSRCTNPQTCPCHHYVGNRS